MAVSDPAVEWWESDPKSPGNLNRCNIGFIKPCDPNADMAEMRIVSAIGTTWDDVYARPMFEVLAR